MLSGHSVERTALSHAAGRCDIMARRPQGGESHENRGVLVARLRLTEVGVWSAVALLAGGCGNFHESSIGKGFTFTNSGGNDKKIVFKGDGTTSVVIDARVDAYTRDGSKIIAARRPPTTGVAGCEYWIIDVNTRVAHRIPDAAEWPDVRCSDP